MTPHEEIRYRKNQKNIDSHFTPVYVYLASCLATFSNNRSISIFEGAFRAIGPAIFALLAVVALKTLLFHPEYDSDSNSSTLTIAMIISLILCPIIASRFY